MIITCTSPRTSKGMTLNGTTLSGDTYGMRQHIKEHWGGRWNPDTKTWTVNPDLVISTINEKSWGFSKILNISDEQPEPVKSEVYGSDGYCHKCHTYCYGDCQS